MQSLRTAPPKALHHFTSAEGLVGIISERILRLTRAVCSNDALELRHMVENARISADVLREAVGHSGSLSEGARSLLAKFCERLNDDRAGWQGDMSLRHAVVSDIFLPDPYVACFCVDANPGVVHWGHYGRAGEGFALEIDSGLLSEVWRNRFVRVCYDVGVHLRTVSDIVLGCIQNENSILEPRTEGFFMRDRASGIADRMEAVIRAVSVGMKAAVFEPENEWRVTWLREVDGELPIKLRSNGPELISHVEMPLPLEAIRKIIVGTKRDLRRTAGSLASYLHSQGMGHVEIEESRIPFR